MSFFNAVLPLLALVGVGLGAWIAGLLGVDELTGGKIGGFAGMGLGGLLAFRRWRQSSEDRKNKDTDAGSL